MMSDPFLINKGKLYYIYTLLTLIFIYRYFQSTPLEAVFYQIYAVFLLLSLCLCVLIIFSHNKQVVRRLSKVDKYFLLLIVIIPFMSALQSSKFFNQPLLLGLLCQRHWFTISAGIVIYALIVKHRVSLKSINNIFVLIALASLIIYTYFHLFSAPVVTDEYTFGNVTVDRGVRYKFSTFFITFGALYYFFKLARCRFSTVYLLLYMMFMGYIIFLHQGRIYLISVLAPQLIYTVFESKLTFKAKLLVFGVPACIISLLAATIFYPEFMEQKIRSYQQVIDVVFYGELTSDYSANARIFAMEVVNTFFKNNPSGILFGAGKVSNQFNEGWNSIFGYFYPSDIGWFGGFFLYGIAGVVMLYIPMILVGIKLFICKAKINDTFLLTLRYMILYYVLVPQQSISYFSFGKFFVIYLMLKALSDLYYEKLNYERQT